VFIRYPEPQLKGSHSGPQPIECHVLNPYPKPQLKDTFRTTTHGTPASPPMRYSKSHLDHALHVPSHLICFTRTTTTIEPKTNSNFIPLIQNNFIRPMSIIGHENRPLTTQLCIITVYTVHSPIIFMHLGHHSIEQYQNL